jgi:hypothetical protein
MGIKHNYTSPIPDDPASAAANKVLPSHWNEDHVITFTPSGGDASLAAILSVSPAIYTFQGGA